MPTDATLKACPFCGSSDLVVCRDAVRWAFVICNRCFARGPFVAPYGTADEQGPLSITLWNTRAEPSRG